MKENNTIFKISEGKHSFLFWLIVPIVLVWLSVSYIVGVAGDKPLWFINQKSLGETKNVISYYQNYGTLIENLDQPFITFWFDDAWLSQYMAAYPILKKYKYAGAIAVPVNSIETQGYMNWAQLQKLQKEGWEITNHSLSHDCKMNQWDSRQVSYEYVNSKFILWKNNLSSDIFATPCGVDSKVMREEARKNFVAYRTVDPGFNDPKNVKFNNLKVKNVDKDDVDLSTLKSWVDESVKNKYWLIITFHKVGEKNEIPSENEFNISIQNLTELIKYVKERGVKVVVPNQILISQTNL